MALSEREKGNSEARTKVTIGTRLYNKRAKAWSTVVGFEMMWEKRPAADPEISIVVKEDGKTFAVPYPEANLYNVFLKDILMVDDKKPTVEDMGRGWQRLANSGLREGWAWQASQARAVVITDFDVARGMASITFLGEDFVDRDEVLIKDLAPIAVQPHRKIDSLGWAWQVSEKRAVLVSLLALNFGNNDTAHFTTIVRETGTLGECPVEDLVTIRAMRPEPKKEAPEGRPEVRTWVWHMPLGKPVFILDVIEGFDRAIVALPIMVFESDGKGIEEESSHMIVATAEWGWLAKLDWSPRELDY